MAGEQRVHREADAGGAAYSPALTDFIFMARNTSYMFVTGPDVVKAVTHEEVTQEELGGAGVHSEKSGVCHVAADSEADTLYLIRKLLEYLPQNNMEDPPFIAGDDPLRMDEALNTIVPDDAMVMPLSNSTITFGCAELGLNCNSRSPRG